MNDLRAALLVLGAAVLGASLPAKAGVWGAQPNIGVAADYNSNPALLDLPSTAEKHGAFTLDAPTSYVGDAFKFSVLPSFRLSSSQGYSSIDSDYEHLTTSAEFDAERDVLTGSAGVARDSSLYHDYLLNGATGVRRDSVNGDLNWDHKLSERLDWDTDLNWSRVRYDEPQVAGAAVLTNYKYASVTPSLSWAQSELDKLTVTAVGGRYDSLDGKTESKSLNLQLGFTRQLTEIWSLTASGGYSRAQNRAEGAVCDPQLLPFGLCFPIPATINSNQNGAIFAVNLARQTSLWYLDAIASRQLLPSGFAFLSRQDSYELKGSYTASARWTFSGDVHRIQYAQPIAGGGTSELKVTAESLSAAWLWSEHWTLTLSATHVLESYGVPRIRPSNSGVTLMLSRQFDWKSFE
jgi:hypothetical protein